MIPTWLSAGHLFPLRDPVQSRCELDARAARHGIRVTDDTSRDLHVRSSA